MTDKGVMVVTGGGRGIGRATAILAAARGYKVAVNYLSDDAAAEEVVRAIAAEGGDARAIKADTAEPQQVAALFEEAAGLGPITALVNNAGLTGPVSRLDEAARETLERVIRVNVLGVLYCSQEAIKRMSKRHGGAGGAIVTVSSGAASLGSPGEYVWYAASKGAVDSMTLGLSKEVGGENIRVNCVSPGLTDTELHEKDSKSPGRVERMAPNIPMGRAATPEEVAAPILWLCSDEASYVNGAILRVAGGR